MLSARHAQNETEQLTGVSSSTTLPIKAKTMAADHLMFGTPVRILKDNHAIPVLYKDGKCLLQLPRVQLATDVYEQESKMYVDVVFSRASVIHNMYQSIASRCEAFCRSHAMFSGAVFNGHIRQVSTHDGSSCCVLRIKLPQNSGKILTNVTGRKDGKTIHMSSIHMHPGCTIIPIVSLEFIYVIAGSVGFNLLLTEAVIV